MNHPEIDRIMALGYPSRKYIDYERFARQCECGQGMNEGFLHEVSGNCYCSSDCTEKYLPDMDELLAEGILFWTDWHYEL